MGSPAAGSSVPRSEQLILVVHTDTWVRRVVCNLLSSAGWATKQVSNGASGLRLAQLLQPALIVVGHELSELPLHDLIELLRADTRTKRIPIIAIRPHNGRRLAVQMACRSPEV
jgi:CheY-like chemotaxis protein